MSSEHNLTESDEGKKVVDQNGDDVGTVVKVDAGQAWVDPDPSVTDKVMTKLGWGSRDEDSYRLDTDAIQTVTDDEIRLRSF